MKEAFDISLVQRGLRLRRSPYFMATQRYGAKAYTVYNHMLLPMNYDDLETEYWKLLQDVTVWDVGVERQVEISGPDGLAFTNMLTPRDLTRCRVGQGKYVVITDEKGGIINDPVLLRLGENHFWLALADSDVLLWAKGVAIHAGLDVEIAEPDVSPMQVQGPRSPEVIRALFGESALNLRYYQFIETDVAGIPVVLTRTGWTGEVGFEIYLRDGRLGDDLWERVMEAGEPFGIAATGPSEIRRIEAGILNYGADMTIQNNPYEVGLDWMIDLDQQADFIGKEALKRIHAQGISQKLVGVEIHGAPIGLLMTTWPVLRDGQQIGRITSAAYSPRLKKNLAFAMVHVAHADLDTELTVLLPETGPRSATIVPRPFVDPDKEIPKG